MKTGVQVSLWILLLLSPSWAEESATAAQGLDRSINHWSQVWKSWGAHTSTTEVEYFGYNAIQSTSHEVVSKSEIHELIERIRQLVESTDSPELVDLESLTQISFPVDKDGKSNGRWGAGHLIQSLDKVRADLSQRSPLREGEIYDPVNFETLHRTIARVDGKEVEYVDSNKQISVFDSYSNTQIRSTRHFVLTPAHLDDYSRWETDIPFEGQFRFSGESPEVGTIELDIDDNTGFVHRMKHVAGPFSEEIFQFLPVLQESGIPVARVIAIVSGKHDAPQNIEVSVVRAIRLGAAIPDERFHVEVPESVLVVKFPEFGAHIPPTRGGARPRMERAESLQPNAVKLSQEHNFGVGDYPQPSPPKSKPLKWLFITNGLALLSLLVFLGIRRSRLSTSKSQD